MRTQSGSNFRPTVALTAAVGLLVGVLTGGCVTEKRTIKPRLPQANTQRPASPDAGTTATTQVPVARPATEASTVSTRVTVALKPLGEVPFDGQVLPLLSPDASFLATQVGAAPTWDALLAAPDARAPYRTRLEIYDLTTPTPTRLGARGAGLPAGWVLGRAADSRGFLAEVINPDGSRHIALVPWDETVEPQWLVRTDAVNAHGALMPDGSLIYCTRPASEPRFAIAIERPAGRAVYTDPDASLLFPLPTPDPTLFYCYARTRTGLELRLVREKVPAFEVEAVWPLSSGGGVIDAYQCANRAVVRPEQPYELLAIHPRMGGLAIFDPATKTAAPMAPGSIGGAWLDSADPLRVFLTTRQGLMHQQAIRTGTGFSVTDAVRVDRPAWVPLRTTDPYFPWILIGPEDSSASPALVLVRMALASPADAAQPPSD